MAALALALLCGALARRTEAGPAASRARASVPPVEVEFVTATTSVAPGGTLRVGIRLVIAPGWHVYGRSPGDSGQAPAVRFTLPEGVVASPLRHPVPWRLVTPPLATYVVTEEALLTADLSVSETYASETIPLRAEVSWLVCKEDCHPGDAIVAIDVPVTRGPTSVDLRVARWFLAADALSPRSLPQGASAREVGPDRVALLPRGKGPWLEATQVELFLDDADPWTLVEDQPWVKTSEGPGLLVPRSTTRGALHASRVRGILVGSHPSSGAFAFDVDVPIEGKLAWEGALPLRRVSSSAGGVPPSTGAPAPVVGAPLPAPLPSSPLPPRPVPGGTPLAAVLLAFVGGLILNVMPCVLPVLSVKALGFVEQAGERPGHVRAHGLVFGAGVLVSFWVMVAMLLALRGAGHAAGWGFQFQDPTFVGACVLLLFAMGLNLLGVYELGARLASAAGSAEAGLRRGTWTGSFASGVLATIIATPCTAPFMGPAIGWALSASVLDAFLVFTALGAGMATPFVALLWFPALLRRVPRAGPWMETLRHVLSFPMFATAVWLAWVFGRLTGVDGLFWLLASVLALAIGAWAFGRYFRGERSLPVRLVLGIALPALALAGTIGSLRLGATTDPGALPPPPSGWIPFTPTVVEERRAAGQPVFLDFTADWCLSCKVNDKVVLSASEVVAAFERLGYARVMADWTRRDPDVTSALKALGRESVPVYVVYPADRAEPPVLLPSAITPGMVVEALERGAVAR